MDLIETNYVDDGALRDQDNVPLDAFLADRDRAQLSTGRGVPFFSGREREVSAFRAMANALLLGRPSNATMVIEGPPGAGKTALLAQFMEETTSLPAAGSGARRWLPVLLDGALAMSPPEIMAAVDEAIARRLAQDCVESEGKRGAADAARRLASFLGQKQFANMRSAARGIMDRGVSAMGFSIGAKGGSKPGTMAEAARQRGADWNRWQVLLLVDEAQGISPKTPNADPGALSSIHQGMVSAPITFCAFGLHGTAAALSEVGVSRLSRGRHLLLSSLDKGSARMAVQRCFEQYEVKNASSWEQAILDRCADWPQHLAAYLDAALTVLRPPASEGDRIGYPDPKLLPSAISSGDAGRREYYDLRLDSLNAGNPRHARFARLLVPELRKEGGAMTADRIIEVLEGEPLSVPPQEADAFLTASLRSGLLSHDGPRRRLRMPIPSFGAYLLDEGVPPKPPARTGSPAP